MSTGNFLDYSAPSVLLGLSMGHSQVGSMLWHVKQSTLNKTEPFPGARDDRVCRAAPLHCLRLYDLTDFSVSPCLCPQRTFPWLLLTSGLKWSCRGSPGCLGHAVDTLVLWLEAVRSVIGWGSRASPQGGSQVPWEVTQNIRVNEAVRRGASRGGQSHLRSLGCSEVQEERSTLTIRSVLLYAV